MLTLKQQLQFGYVLVLLALLPWQSIHASALDAAAAGEYELKAAFLYNFTKFVSWPDSAFADSQTPFRICIIGQDSFETTLTQTVGGEKVGEHPIEVQRFQQLEGITECHIIFVGTRSDRTIESIAEAVKELPVLVVGDETNSTSRGAVIGFQVVNRRIKLQVNLAAARKANLQISSKLLQLSTVVNGN